MLRVLPGGSIRLRLLVASINALVAFACQPPGVSWRELPPAATLGEAAYAIVATNVAESAECAGERSTALAASRRPFVDAFDKVITPEVGVNLAGSVESVLLPLVDDQRLPALTRELADALALLVDDAVDPERAALDELLALLQGRSLLAGRHLFGLGQRTFTYDAGPALVAALADLGATEDLDSTLAQRAVDLAAGALERAATAAACSAPALTDLHQDLLRDDRLAPEVDLGAPAFAVLGDRHGNPAVRVDPQTGRLYAPFVDADQDGAADVGADGRAVDLGGQPLFLAPFDDGEGRDAYGRALAPDGEPLFAYVDAKRTGLSVLLQFAGEAFSAGVPADAVALARIGMGAPVACVPASPGCRTYPDDDHPLADLAWALIEDLRYPRTMTLLATFAALLRNEPETAEQVLITAGDLLVALDAGGVTFDDPELLALSERLVPLFADVLEQDNSTGASTARLLLDVLHQLGQDARDLPEELRLNLAYVALAKDEVCSPAPPDESRSVPVDYALPRRYLEVGVGWVDNRSAFEQAIELLAAADCGSVPFSGGQTVAEVVIGVMADSSPSTACTIIDSSLGVMNILPGVSATLGAAALDLIGCDGDAVWADLMALDALAKSGVLDAYLPLANAFDDRGQLRTLIDILRLVADDLGRDDAAPGQSVVRRALPTVLAVLEQGGLDSLFDLNDLLVTVPALDGDGTMADVVVDSFAFLTDDRQPLLTRRGWVAGTSHALQILAPLRLMARRLELAGARAGFARIVAHLRGYLSRTVLDDQGTPSPADDRRRLADRRLLPAYEVLLAFAARLFDLDATTRTCAFDALRQDSQRFLTSPDLAAALRLGDAYAAHPERAAIDQSVADALTPSPSASGDRLGAWAQVLAALVQQADPETPRGRELLRFGGQALQSFAGGRLFSTLAVLWADDPHHLLFGVVARACDAGPTSHQEPPAQLFGQLWADLAGRTDANACRGTEVWQRADAERSLAQGIDFLRDEQTGLPAIYRLIRLRGRE